MQVALNGAVAGASVNGHFFFVDRPPGLYALQEYATLFGMVAGGGAQPVVVKAGQTTYVKLNVGMSAPSVQLMAPDEGMKAMASEHAVAALAPGEAVRPAALVARAKADFDKYRRLSGLDFQLAAAPEASGHAAISQSAKTGAFLGSSVAPGSGIYQVESKLTFNVLDKVYFDPQSGLMALIGHSDPRFGGPSLPYLQDLATLLESPDPEFSLTWTPDSSSRVDALFSRQLSQSESDAQAERWGRVVDSNGVTHVGRLILPQLGIDPIVDGRDPGDLGADVASAGSGRVFVVKVQPGSAAERAGLSVGDIITSVRDGWPVFYDREFRRQIRFAGAGSTIRIELLRNGESRTLSATLDAADDTDRWEDVTKEDVLGLMYRHNGQPQAADLLQAMVLMGAKIQAAGWAPYNAMTEALGMAADYQHLKEVMGSGSASYDQAYAFGLKMAQRFDATFQYAGSPVTNRFQATINQSHDPSAALAAIIDEYDKQAPAKAGELIDGLMMRPGTGILAPPELVEEEYGIHPEMVPQYLGVPADSQLARLMLATDYLCKQLTNSQDLTGRVPGYETQIQYQIDHPDAGRPMNTAWRVWLDIGAVDVASSSDGNTLALHGARMQFHMRQTDAEAHDLPNRAEDGYGDLLTRLYDPLEMRFPVLHQAREAAKLATAAEWIRARNPDVRLPIDGRSAWKGPDRVQGLVYIYLTNDTQRQAKIFKIAEGGDRIKPPPLPSSIPVDPSIVDLRTSPAAFVQPANGVFSGGTASRYAASWVSALPGRADEQAIILEPSGRGSLSATPTSLAAAPGATGKGILGGRGAVENPDLGGQAPAGQVANPHTAGEQLAAAAGSGSSALTAGSAEAESREAGCQFEEGRNCHSTVAPPAAPTKTPAADALEARLKDKASDPAIHNSLEWYRKLELRKSDTERELATLQARLDKKDGDPAILDVQKASLQKELSQDVADQTTALNQMQARAGELGVKVDLSVNFDEAPAKDAAGSTGGEIPANAPPATSGDGSKSSEPSPGTP